MESDLQEALRAWMGSPLSEKRSNEILERLRTDSAFRNAFTELLWTLCLAKTAQAPSPRWINLCEEIGLIEDAVDSDNHRLEENVLQEIQAKPSAFVRSWWRSAAFGGIAAALVIACSLPWILSVPEKQEPPIATLVATRAAAWKGKTPTVGNPLPNRRIELDSGSISLGFPSGVLLFVEGPADIDLLDSQRVFCRQGKLRMRVPPGAEGFAVDTPGGVITDLGTELGIAVQPGKNTRVAVFEGKAEASLKVPGQDGIRTQLLGSNQGAELVAASGEIKAASLDGFLSSAEIPKPSLRLSDSYPAIVRSSGAALYWRLNQQDGDRVPAETPDSPGLIVRGEAAITPDEGGHPSVLLKGGALVAEDSWQLPSESYAIELWFCADPMSLGGMVGLATDLHFEKHFAYLEFTSKVPGTSSRSPALRFLSRRPAAGGGGMNIFATHPTLTYSWHHLVAQQSQGWMELYLDGKRVGSAQGTPGPENTLCNIQFGVLREQLESTRPRRRGPDIERPFQGRLAEIAIYPHTLSPAEIQLHASQRNPL